MKPERRMALAMIAGFVFVILAILAVVITRESNALYYTVRFKNAEQLQAGDRVVINGVNIGVVKWVQLFDRPTFTHVRLKIEPKYANFVHLDSTAIIRGVSFPNVSGQKVVEVVNADDDTTAAMRRNALIDGVGGDVELVAWKVRHKLKGNGDSLKNVFGVLKDQVGKLSDEMAELKENPQVREAIAQLGVVIDEIKEKGKEGLIKAQEQWPMIKEKIGPVIKQMEQTGRQHVAEVIRQAMEWIEKSIEELRRVKGAEPNGTPAAPAANRVT